VSRALDAGRTGNALAPLPGYGKAGRFIHEALWLLCAALVLTAVLLPLLLLGPHRPLQARPVRPAVIQPAPATVAPQRAPVKRIAAWHLAAQE